jgi:hypothetical protein
MIELPSFPFRLPRTGFHILGLAGLIFATQIPIAATIIFNNTGSTPLPASPGGFGYEINGSYLSDDQLTAYNAAAQFTSGIDAELTAIDIYFAGRGGSYSDRVTFAIFSDLDGAPGEQIGDDWTISSASIQLTSIAASGITFTAGTKYWLVATGTDPNSSGFWGVSATDTGVHALGYVTNGLQGWSVKPAGDGQNLEFAIEGDALSAAPESATWVLMLSGAAIGVWRRAARSVAGVD